MVGVMANRGRNYRIIAWDECPPALGIMIGSLR